MKVHIFIKTILAGLAFLIFSSPAFSQQVPDAELKTNVEPVKNALETVQQLSPKTYEYNRGKYPKLKLPAGQQYGFMGEEVQRVLPELVNSKSESYMVGKNKYQMATLKDTDLVSLIPLLVAAIQEQQEEINQLRQQIQSSSSTK
ncbi:MAG: hypothetical protein JWQ14_3233 [Adhaeribacter sp.]|jgi:hypothetical protein|nr:hypothetical protein [Adhaeribacter sp.]